MGGPLLCPLRNSSCNQNYYLAGVILSGSSTCGSGNPSIYTATFPIMDWILATIHSQRTILRLQQLRKTFTCDSTTLNKGSTSSPQAFQTSLGPFLHPPSLLESVRQEDVK